jgi:ArsR family transcriptional regulator
LVSHRRVGGEVIYSLALPEVRDLLLAARTLLETKHASSDVLVDEITRGTAADK